MSISKADDLAGKILRDAVGRLDNDIVWREKDLAGTLAVVVKQRAILDELRQQRTAITDAVNVHFPVATW